MKNRNGAPLLFAACLGCIIVIFCGAYSLIGGGSGSSDYKIPAVLDDGDTPVIAENDTGSSIIPVPDAEENAGSSQETVPTSAEGNVLGSITGKFFSSSSAGCRYNNVYVKNNTPLEIDIKKYLQSTPAVSIEKSSAPQVLIVHTHTTESYMLCDRDYYTDADATHSKDENYNIVAVGNVFEARLTAAGIGVVHNKTIHDYPSYSGSYNASKETILKMLEEYPSVKVVLDIHRDSISDGSGGKIKPVTEIKGKKAAQVMLVMGSQSGAVTLFPEWEKNFALAVRYQQTMEVMYPGLARPLALYSKKYNEYLHPGSMLIEVGTDANTLDEALYGAQLAADALVCFLNTLV